MLLWLQMIYSILVNFLLTRQINFQFFTCFHSYNLIKLLTIDFVEWFILELDYTSEYKRTYVWVQTYSVLKLKTLFIIQYE